MATEDEIIGRLSLKPLSQTDDEEALVERFGLKPIEAPEPITGPVGPSGGVVRPNVYEGVNAAKEVVATKQAQQAAAAQQAAVQQQTDPREFSISQTKKMFADMRKAQGGALSREQEVAEKMLLDEKKDELNAPAEMAAEERRIAEPYFKSLEGMKRIDELAGQADDGIMGVVKGSAAGAVSGGLGILESIFRTPDAVARGLSMLDKAAKDSGNELFDRMIPDVIRQDREKGFVTADIADQISIARKTLPLLAPAFAKNEILGRQAEKATDEALKYAFTLGKEGNPHELMEVVTNPHAWGGFIGQAAPSLFAAYKSGGSLGFMAWMEGMETASDAADFEKTTGIPIDDAEFSKAVGQAAIINAIFEKIAPGQMRKMKTGTPSLYKLAQVPAIGAIEGSTEAIQAFNSNLSKRHYDEKQKLTEGLLASFMGGMGAGTGGATLAAATGRGGADIAPVKATAPEVDPTLPAEIPSEQKVKLFDEYLEAPKSPKEVKEAEFIRANMDKVDAKYNEAVKSEYSTNTTNIVSADLAKTVDVEGREPFSSEQSTDRHEASSAFAKMKYDQLLADPTTQDDPVMVLGGISGAGKTSSIKTAGENTSDYAAVYDTNLTNKATGERIIEKALASNPNRQVSVVYVDRDPVRAFIDGVYKRFQGHKERRIVPIDVHLNNYKSRQAIEELSAQYKDNPRVGFVYLDNNGGPGQVKSVALEQLPQVRYTPEEVKNELTKFIQQKLQVGEISPAEAQTFLGRYDKGTAPAERGQDLRTQDSAEEDRVIASAGATPVVQSEPSNLNTPAANVSEPAQTLISEEDAVIGRSVPARGTPGPVSQNRRGEGTSRAFERVRGRLSDLAEADPLTYNIMNLAEDTARAVRFVQEKPDDARRVALGFIPPPAGVTETAISIAYAEEMREAGNEDAMIRAEQSRSLRQTRRGQEIAAERGRANENSASHFIQLVIKHRLQGAGKALFGRSETAAKKQATARLQKTAEIAKQAVDAKKISIQEAQAIINGIIC